MKKGYIVAAIVWLTALAATAILTSVLRPNSLHINWSLTELLKPGGVIIVLIPSIALLLLFFALMLNRGQPRIAKIIVSVSFAILLVLTLVGSISLWGLVFAPAAFFLYKAVAGNNSPKTG